MGVGKIVNAEPEPSELSKSEVYREALPLLTSRTYLIFGDIEGKLDVLRVECTKCDRKGRYSVAKLIAKHGRKGNMSGWVSDLKGDCPKRDAAGLQNRCDVVCPDLPKVL